MNKGDTVYVVHRCVIQNCMEAIILFIKSMQPCEGRRTHTVHVYKSAASDLHWSTGLLHMALHCVYLD